MATTAQCVFCFETLAASLESRKALSLREVEQLWAKYDDRLEQEQEDSKVAAGDQFSDSDGKALRPREVSRLQGVSPASGSSSSSSQVSASSSSSALDTSNTSSKSSLFSFASSRAPKEEEHPVYVTWNTLHKSGHKSLRGCIGTFEPQPLSEGLREYALISAFQDHRFNQIARHELPSLSNTITLLQNFTPCDDPMDWVLGRHGLRIHFQYKGRRYGATYLPDVATEQGWTKEETLVSLMRKAGWTGKEKDWKSVDVKCVKYEGLRADADWKDYEEWREWVAKEGLV